jgi:hypothetical protein
MRGPKMNSLRAFSGNEGDWAQRPAQRGGARSPQRVRHHRDLPYMRSDLPSVTPFVLHHATTVPVGHDGWRFERTCTSTEGATICSVGVADIYVEKGDHRTTSSGVANHDHRVADPDLGWMSLAVFSRCAEHLLQELDKVPCLVNHDSWSNGVPALRDERRAVGCFLHREFSWF